MVSTADAPMGAAALPGSSVERAAAYMQQLAAAHAARDAVTTPGIQPGGCMDPRCDDDAAAHAAMVGTPPGRLTTLAKNRRWARMQQLEAGGEFFSEQSMRQRAPGLWHEHIGRHEGGPPAPAPPAAGEGWAHSLLRAHDAAQTELKLAEERAREDAAMSEQEDSDEEEEEGGVTMTGEQGAANGGQAAAANSGGPAAAAAAATGQQQQQQQDEGDGVGPDGPAGAAAAAAAQRRHDFLLDMRARFLCGDDAEYVDYAEIDADASLDDEEHLRRQRDQDAEDAYFDASDDGLDIDMD